jgi:hypothetical protein
MPAEPLELLTHLMQRLDAMVLLYERLGDCAASKDIRVFFARLSEESRRMRSMIGNRYDLEKLRPGG